MAEARSKHIIHALQLQWSRKNLLSWMLMAVSVAIFSAVVVIKLGGGTWYVLPVITVIAATAVLLFLRKQITTKDVTAYINTQVPAVEESAHLLMKPYHELNFFEKMQLRKVDDALVLPLQEPAKIRKRFRLSLIWLLAAVALSAAVYVIPLNTLRTTTSTGTEDIATKPEVKLAEIDDANIIIKPPAYTGKGARKQDRFNISAEEGATISWHITTTKPVKELQLIFNDKSVIGARAVETGGTGWTATRNVSSPGFYQVKIGNSISELYRIEMIKDKPPAIVVNAPKPLTVVDPRMEKRTQLKVTITDDYGVRSTSIFATIASGSGEAVKFTEQQLSFPNFSSGGRQHQLQRPLDLASMGLKPGDELYFYVAAIDNHNQEKRSDIHVVRLEDTAQLVSVEGMATGVDIQPEFFRSQRQIIIETEQLLRDKPKLSAEEFKNKSNDLGVDQKLLRLRYGKFLGEETDTDIGDGHDHEEEGHTEEAATAESIIDQYSHKHDISEDATFFDAQTKKQLKATLEEMWKAELQLRTIKPKDALPFEYKALKLLKDLQQKTRAYVAKTGTKTTPLKPEKRLTGDLAEVTQPVVQRALPNVADPSLVIRKAIGTLEEARNKQSPPRSSIEVLEQASMQLATMAATDPAGYLSALQGLRKILSNNYTNKDIDIAGRGLQKLLSANKQVPQQHATGTGTRLAERYFKNLNKRNE